MNIIKEKINGIIKVRTCANGSKKKRYLKERESAASPTVLLSGLFSTLVINAYEGREVATFDVTGAYLRVDIPQDKKVLLKLRVTFMDITCQINPEHKNNVKYKIGQKVPYMLVFRAIYGCI